MPGETRVRDGFSLVLILAACFILLLSIAKSSAFTSTVLGLLGQGLSGSIIRSVSSFVVLAIAIIYYGRFSYSRSGFEDEVFGGTVVGFSGLVFVLYVIGYIVGFGRNLSAPAPSIIASNLVFAVPFFIAGVISVDLFSEGLTRLGLGSKTLTIMGVVYAIAVFVLPRLGPGDLNNLSKLLGGEQIAAAMLIYKILPNALAGLLSLSLSRIGDYRSLAVYALTMAGISYVTPVLPALDHRALALVMVSFHSLMLAYVVSVPRYPGFERLTEKTISVGGVVVVALAFSSMAITLSMGYRPMVLVSGSMEPLYHVGDIVIAYPVPKDQVEIGDVIAYIRDDRSIVVHRVVEINDGGRTIITKGDANEAMDKPIDFKRIIGKIVFHVPYMGLPYFVMVSVTGSSLTASILIALMAIGLIVGYDIVQGRAREAGRPSFFPAHRARR